MLCNNSLWGYKMKIELECKSIELGVGDIVEYNGNKLCMIIFDENNAYPYGLLDLYKSSIIISFHDIEDIQEDVKLVARSSEVVLKKGE